MGVHICDGGVFVTGRATTEMEKFKERKGLRAFYFLDNDHLNRESSKTIEWLIKQDFNGLMKSMGNPKDFQRYIDKVTEKRDNQDRHAIQDLGQRIEALKSKHKNRPRVA